MASAENAQQAQPDTDAQTQLTGHSESQQTQQGMDRLAQQPGTGLNSEAQQAQQELPAGGALTKPKPVGIGHMCRAISTLTGGMLVPPPPSMHLIEFLCSTQFLDKRGACSLPRHMLTRLFCACSRSVHTGVVLFEHRQLSCFCAQSWHKQ